MEQQHKRFFDAADKLVGAFIMGTIFHGKCASCAVGTMCDGDSEWSNYHTFLGAIWEEEEVEKGKRIILKTGYSIEEIFQIEKAFEFREKTLLDDDESEIDRVDVDGFLGLCNVFDYLVSIEDFSDEENKVNLIEMCLSK